MERLQELCGSPLPRAYREYLEWMGERPAQVLGQFQGDISIDEAIEIQEEDGNPPPGSLHTEGTLKVYFHPAKPGHRYRCDFSGGQRFGLLK